MCAQTYAGNISPQNPPNFRGGLSVALGLNARPESHRLTLRPRPPPRSRRRAWRARPRRTRTACTPCQRQLRLTQCPGRASSSWHKALRPPSRTRAPHWPLSTAQSTHSAPGGTAVMQTVRWPVVAGSSPVESTFACSFFFAPTNRD